MWARRPLCVPQFSWQSTERSARKDRPLSDSGMQKQNSYCPFSKIYSEGAQLGKSFWHTETRTLVFSLSFWDYRASAFNSTSKEILRLAPYIPQLFCRQIKREIGKEISVKPSRVSCHCTASHINTQYYTLLSRCKQRINTRGHW